MNGKITVSENTEIYFTEKQSLEEILIQLLIDEFRRREDDDNESFR